MIIHTHEKDEVNDLLVKNGFKFKIKNKKAFNNLNKKFYNGLPEFNLDDNILNLTFYDVKVNTDDDKKQLFKLFNKPYSKVNYIHYKKNISEYDNYNYEINHWSG